MAKHEDKSFEAIQCVERGLPNPDPDHVEFDIGLPYNAARGTVNRSKHFVGQRLALGFSLLNQLV